MSQPSKRKNVRRYRAPRGTMVRSVNVFVRWVLWWLFSKVLVAPRALDAIREAASRGPVVYVLQTRSRVDQLYYNYLLSTSELPLARWSNGPRTIFFRRARSILAHIFRRPNPAPPAELLAEAVRVGHAVLLFLTKALNSDAENLVYSQGYIERLIQLQDELDAPIQVVPLAVVWDRRSDDFHPSLLDEIFGPRQHPGFFRKIWHVFTGLGETFIKVGNPLALVGEVIDVRALCADDGPVAARAERLREHLSQQVERERSVAVGPRFKKGSVMQREMMKDPDFLTEAEEAGVEMGLDAEQARARARKNLARIGSDFSMLGVKFLASLLTPLWHLIYDGLVVDDEGLDRVRAAARDSRIIVIPSHKSHIDYLVISYLFYVYGLVPPHIAAGDNLNFPPMGTLFRRAGAFFIRRSFKDDPVYEVCVRRYIGKLMLEGHPIEFFIEGGRSRTGKLLAPRFGMMRMLMDSFLAEPIEKLKVVPCSVAYEKVIEATGYRKEIMGGKKKQENLGALLRSTKVLISRYGRLYVNFGTPLDVGEYMQRYHVDAKSDNQAQQRLTERFGYRVIYEINRASTLTPSALTGLVLVNNPTRGMERERLLQCVGYVLDLLTRKSIRFSPTLRTSLGAKRALLAEAVEGIDINEAHALSFLSGPTEAKHPAAAYYHVYGKSVEALVDESIKLFSDGKLVDLTRVHAGKEDDRYFYSVPEGARGELSYYKNMIVHALVPEALLAIALNEPQAAQMQVDPLMERTLFLSKLFKYEFFYEERAEFSNVFWRTFDEFAERGWVAVDNGREGPVRLSAYPSPPLDFYRNLVLTFLEAYALAAAEFDYLKGRWVAEKDFLEHLMVSCRLHYHEGQVRFLETLAKPTFQNAMRRFGEWGLLETEMVTKRRRAVRMIRRAGSDEQHTEMVDKLRGLLRGRSALEARTSAVA